MERNARYDYGTPQMLRTQAAAYAQGLPLQSPEISPPHRQPGPLPPTLLFIGTAELLLDEARAFADKAAGAIQLELLQELPHNGQLFPDEHPEGRRALDLSGEFLKRRLVSA